MTSENVPRVCSPSQMRSLQHSLHHRHNSSSPGSILALYYQYRCYHLISVAILKTDPGFLALFGFLWPLFLGLSIQFASSLTTFCVEL